MKQLTLLDKMFLLAETREVPMHVGVVSLFTVPEGADATGFLHSLAKTLGDAQEFLPPFGDRLKTGRLGLAGPAFWEPDPALDVDYHIRHSALPQPGRVQSTYRAACSAQTPGLACRIPPCPWRPGNATGRR